MVNKELKKLSRRELVDIIYQMKKNEEQLLEEINALKIALEDRRIRLSEAGSIAEAAAAMTNLFSTAQETADLYLREIASMKADAEQECRNMIDEAKKMVSRFWGSGNMTDFSLAENLNRYYGTFGNNPGVGTFRNTV